MAGGDDGHDADEGGGGGAGSEGEPSLPPCPDSQPDLDSTRLGPWPEPAAAVQARAVNGLKIEQPATCDFA